MEEEKRISEEELKKDVAAAEARIRKTDDFTSPEELYGGIDRFCEKSIIHRTIFP